MFDHRLFQLHRYALLDPVSRDVISQDVATLPLLPSCMAEDCEHLLPRLISLDALTPEQRGALLDSMDAMEPDAWPPLCALLDCNAETDRLAAHLKEVQVLKSYRGASVDKAWLRLHDPRVFVQLHRLMTDEDRAALFGPVMLWTIPVGGEWRSFERPASSVTSPYPRQRWPMARIANIGIINRVLSKAGITRYQDTLPASEKIEMGIARAREAHGLTDAADLVEFAYHEIDSGDGFDRHPAIAPLIRDPQDGENSRLSDRLARVDGAVWQTMNA